MVGLKHEFLDLEPYYFSMNCDPVEQKSFASLLGQYELPLGLTAYPYFAEKCERNVIEANAHVVVSSLPKLPWNKSMPTLNGTEPWCWKSNFKEQHLHVDFKEYAVLCALNFNLTFNGVLELTYGNKISNKSKVFTHNMSIFSHSLDI